MLLIVIFSYISSPPPHRWVIPLIGIDDYIGSTFLSNYIIAIYNNCFFSGHNGVVSPSLLLIVLFWSFSVMPLHGWVRPLVEIAAYTGSTFLSNNIIAIYCHTFYPSTTALFHCHRCLLTYFEVFLWFLPIDEFDHSLGLLITLEVIFWAIIL